LFVWVRLCSKTRCLCMWVCGSLYIYYYIWAADSRTCVCIGPDTGARKVHDGFWRAAKICGPFDLLCVPTPPYIPPYFCVCTLTHKCVRSYFMHYTHAHTDTHTHHTHTHTHPHTHTHICRKYGCRWSSFSGGNVLIYIYIYIYSYSSLVVKAKSFVYIALSPSLFLFFARATHLHGVRNAFKTTQTPMPLPSTLKSSSSTVYTTLHHIYLHSSCVCDPSW